MNIITIALGAFLAAAVTPLAKRVVVGLGLGILSFTAISTLVNNLINMAKTEFSGLPNMAMGFAGLLGLGEALGIISGAMIVRVAIVTMKRYGVLI